MTELFRIFNYKS